MSLLIPELERQLRDVVDARQGRTRRARGSLSRLLVAIAAVLPALVIGAFALVLLAHRHHVGVAARGPHAIPGETTQFERCGQTAGSRMGAATPARPTGSTVSVASGTISGYSWDLRARADQNGYLAVEDGRLMLDGRAYSMCGGAPNPAEFALVAKDSHGIVYGYIANPGHQTIAFSGGADTITVPETVDVLGGTFFIVSLPRSACSYPSLTVNATTPPPNPQTDQHYFGFGACRPNQPVQVTEGHGSWSGTDVRGTGPPRGYQGPSGPTLTQLLHHFAVLRRPQTAADRSWRGGDEPGGPFDATLTGLTRLAQTLASGNRVFLTVDQTRRAVPGRAAPAVGSVLMSVALVDRQGDSDGALYAGQVADYTIFPVALGARPVRSLIAARRRGQIPAGLRLMLRRQSKFGPPVWTSVLPDGVASVRWIFICRPNPISNCHGFHSPLVVELPVHENVVATRIPATDKCADAGCRPTTVIWYNAAGQQTASYNAQGALGPGPQPAPFPGAP